MIMLVRKSREQIISQTDAIIEHNDCENLMHIQIFRNLEYLDDFDFTAKARQMFVLGKILVIFYE